MKTGNQNYVFKPKKDVPFWNQNLNPITMLPGVPISNGSLGLKTQHIIKKTNHFVKNYT